MSLGTANRDGGKTSESGHLRPLSKIFGGNILGNPDTSLKVVQRAAGANMSVDVGIGDAMLYRSDGTYGHPVYNDAVYNLPIAAADGSNPRRDIVVIYVDYTQTPSTAVSNNTNGVVKVMAVAGTPAGSPSDPSAAAIQSAVGSGNPWAYLARARVGAGASSLANAVIDDLRVPIQTRGFSQPFTDIINGACRVAQRAAPNLSSSYQYGAVDRFAAKGAGTAVSAGTISQATTANVGQSGTALKIAGVTLTGSGEVYLRYRMEAKDAIRYRNGAASFAAKVYHDVGSACNYLITLRKPSVADNFTSVSDIANSGNISVPSGASTLISFENINSGNLGDVSNGLEIEIKITTGAITAKNFEFAEFQLNRGVIAQQFTARSFADDLQACYRYFQQVTEPHHMGIVNAAANGVSRMGWELKPAMRVAPTLTATTQIPVFDGSGISQINAITVFYNSINRIQYDGNLSVTLGATRPCVAYSGGPLAPIFKSDAEL